MDGDRGLTGSRYGSQWIDVAGSHSPDSSRNEYGAECIELVVGTEGRGRYVTPDELLQ